MYRRIHFDKTNKAEHMYGFIVSLSYFNSELPYVNKSVIQSM